jgi:hypothetical protein
MRYAIQIIAFTLILSIAALTGCGPQDTDPKPVNVKHDPRIKRAVESGGEKKEQANIPAK